MSCACREVLGDFFSTSESPSLSGDGLEPAIAASADSMDVDEETAGSEAEASLEREKSVEETVPPVARYGRRLQSNLCSLLHVSLAAADSPPSPSSTAASTVSAIKSSSRSTSSRVTSWGDSSSGTSTAGTKKAGSLPPAVVASPMLLVPRQWRLEDGEDTDEEDEAASEGTNKTPTGGESDSTTAAVVAAFVSISKGVAGSLTASGSGGETTTTAPVELNLSSPETLKSIVASLLGGESVGKTVDGTCSSRSSSRRGGASKDMEGAGDPNGQGRRGALKSQKAGVSEGGDGGSKKRSRASDGDANIGVDIAAPSTPATAVSASSSSSKTAASAPAAPAKVLFTTPAEGLTKLNAILRKPSLAILASSLQLAMVREYQCP